MPNYVVIAPPNSTLSDSSIRDEFDHWFPIIPNQTWAIYTPIETCSDVRDKLRSEPAEGKSCVVVKVTEYNGYANKDIWEKLESWRRL